MTLPILYSFRRCPYAIRARMAILAAGLVCELREVSLSNKPETMLLASPKATLPVMVLSDGRVLDESLDIMRYALGQNDPANWLGPMNDQHMDLVATNDDVFKIHLDHYKYPDKYDGNPMDHRDAAMAILGKLNHQLETEKFLTGDRCVLVDAAIFPFVRQFAAVNEAWFDRQPVSHLRNWLKGFLTSAAFEMAMVNAPIWKPIDPITCFGAMGESQ
jgi:glutathione S-transferase